MIRLHFTQTQCRYHLKPVSPERFVTAALYVIIPLSFLSSHRIHGVNVYKDCHYIYDHLNEKMKSFGITDAKARDILDAIDGHIGLGYGQSTQEEIGKVFVLWNHHSTHIMSVMVSPIKGNSADCVTACPGANSKYKIKAKIAGHLWRESSSDPHKASGFPLHNTGGAKMFSCHGTIMLENVFMVFKYHRFPNSCLTIM